jgi:hypothetical protein
MRPAPSRTTVRCLSCATVALALALCTASAASAVLELDATTFRAALLSESERDLAVLFVASSDDSRDSVSTWNKVASTLKLTPASSIVLCIYDVGLHGSPRGLHVHSDDVFLFPALEKEPLKYEDDHDHDHGHGHGHGHGRTHALDAGAIMAWLGRHTTFPAEVRAPHSNPKPTLEQWRGREAQLFAAVKSGVEALDEQFAELRSQLAEARAALDACRAAAANPLKDSGSCAIRD